MLFLIKNIHNICFVYIVCVWIYAIVRCITYVDKYDDRWQDNILTEKSDNDNIKEQGIDHLHAFTQKADKQITSFRGGFLLYYH